MMRQNALKGNDRIRLMKLFLAFLTKALPTEGRTHALLETRGRIYDLQTFYVPDRR